MTTDDSMTIDYERQPDGTYKAVLKASSTIVLKTSEQPTDVAHTDYSDLGDTDVERYTAILDHLDDLRYDDIHRPDAFDGFYRGETIDDFVVSAWDDYVTTGNLDTPASLRYAVILGLHAMEYMSSEWIHHDWSFLGPDISATDLAQSEAENSGCEYDHLPWRHVDWDSLGEEILEDEWIRFRDPFDSYVYVRDY